MPLLLDQLSPYKAFTLFEGKPEILAAAKLKELQEEARTIIESAAQRTKISVQFNDTTEVERLPDGLSALAMHYTLKQQPSWSQSPTGPTDVLHHLLLFIVVNTILAVCASDRGLGRRFIAATQSHRYPAWSRLHRVSAQRLNAFLREYPTKTLWLSGLHRSVSVKADNKVLSGSDLRDALDPLGDQTYHFTSARSGGHRREIGTDVIGVSPRQGKIWIGPTKNWEEFVEQTLAVLKQVSQVQEVKTPIPILAREIQATDGATRAFGAFDVAFLPPEHLSEVEPDLAETIERWHNHGSWSVASGSGLNFALEVKEQGSNLGTIKVTLEPIQNYWKPFTQVEPIGRDQQDKLKEFAYLCERTDIVKIYYESQHTYGDGALFLSILRDIPFDDFRFENFDGVDIDREKPYRNPVTQKGEDPERTGERGERSLFTWCWKKFRPGWLWCDDGAGEIADFIHLEPKEQTLRFIHVKAANGADPNRKMAVAPYEVVCSQALKNLRHLEASEFTKTLREKLQQKKAKTRIKRAWKNGKLLEKKDWFKLPDSISKIPYSKLKKEVIILQPHVTERMLKSYNPTEIRRGKHLHTLLNSIKAEVNHLGARFSVLAPRS